MIGGMLARFTTQSVPAGNPNQLSANTSSRWYWGRVLGNGKYLKFLRDEEQGALPESQIMLPVDL